MTTPIRNMEEITENEDGSEITANENFRTLEVGSGLIRCISATTTAPPGSPADGDVYVLGSGTPTGVWAGHGDDVAYYRNTDWAYFTPVPGDVAYANNSGLWYQYVDVSDGWMQIGGFLDLYDAPASYTANYMVKVNSGGTALELAHAPLDYYCFVNGAPTNSQVLLRQSIARGSVIPINFAGSYAESTVAATASTVFTVAQNGSTIGTITFAIAGTVGTFATSGGTAKTLARTDILTITNQASADATLANVSFTLVSARNFIDS